ncbi:hypothetical protein GGF31_006723 [Allomyces arbusculus]|nr:hypothetical protein GGF31_006723 [Allomyces arbusculus]
MASRASAARRRPATAAAALVTLLAVLSTLSSSTTTTTAIPVVEPAVLPISTAAWPQWADPTVHDRTAAPGIWHQTAASRSHAPQAHSTARTSVSSITATLASYRNVSLQLPATPNFTNVDFPALSSADLKTASSKAKAWAMGGLEVWVRYAQAWRVAVRGTQPLTPAMTNFSNGPSAALRAVILPTAIFAGGMLVLGLLLLLLSPLACCCFVCRVRKPGTCGPVGLRKGKGNPLDVGVYTPKMILRTKIAFAAVLFFQIIVVICMVQGSALFTRGLANTAGSLTNTAQAINTFLYAVQPVARVVLNTTQTAATTAIDSLLDVNATLPGFIVQLNTSASTLAADVTSAGQLVTLALATGTALNASLSNVTRDAAHLATTAQSALTDANALNSQFTVAGTGEQYQLAVMASFPPASSITVPTPPSANGLAAILAQLANPGVDFVAQAAAVRAGVGAANTTILAMLQTVRAQVLAQLAPAVDTARQVVDSQTDPRATQGVLGGVVLPMVTSFQSALLQYTPMVKQVDTIRYFVQLAIAIFFVTSLCGVALSVATKTPAVPKQAAWMWFVIAGVVFVLGGIYFPISIAWNEACAQIDDAANPMAGAASLLNAPDLPKYAKLGLGALDYCQQNQSVLMALEKTQQVGAVFGNGTSLNLTTLATSVFDTYNITGLAQAGLNVDANSLVPVTPATVQAAFDPAQAALAGVNFTAVAAAVNVTVDTATLDQAYSDLTTLRSGVTDTSFTYGASYTAAEKARCVTDFQQRIDLVLAQLNAANATANALRVELPRVQANAAALAPVAGAVNATARAITADVAHVTSVIAGYIASERTRLVTTKVPAVKAAVAQFATDTDAYLATSLSCYPAAVAVAAAVTGMCTTMQGGIDATWLAWWWHGVFAVAGAVVFTYLFRIATQVKEGMAAGVPVMMAEPPAGGSGSALLPVEVKKAAGSRAGSLVPQEGGKKGGSRMGSVVPERSAALAPSSPM